MKAVTAIVVLALGALASCQTAEPIWFIATPGYVEAQIAAREDALRRDYDVRIEALSVEVVAQREATDELAGLSEVIREVEASNNELRDLAARVEREIADLPEQTIRTIVDVLTRHLEESE